MKWKSTTTANKTNKTKKHIEEPAWQLYYKKQFVTDGVQGSVGWFLDANMQRDECRLTGSWTLTSPWERESGHTPVPSKHLAQNLNKAGWVGSWLVARWVLGAALR